MEQKSDQGVEGPGGTGGSGSSVSDGVNPFYFLMGGGDRSPGLLYLPLLSLPLTTPLTLPGTASAAKQGLKHLRWV